MGIIAWIVLGLGAGLLGAPVTGLIQSADTGPRTGGTCVGRP